MLSPVCENRLSVGNESNTGVQSREMQQTTQVDRSIGWSGDSKGEEFGDAVDA